PATGPPTNMPIHGMRPMMDPRIPRTSEIIPNTLTPCAGDFFFETASREGEADGVSAEIVPSPRAGMGAGATTGGDATAIGSAETAAAAGSRAGLPAKNTVAQWGHLIRLPSTASGTLSCFLHSGHARRKGITGVPGE